MRVYALAKQLGMENRDLIPELKRMGITVASHSSALDDDVVQKVLEKLGPKLKAHGKATGRAAEADAGRGERSKVGIASDHAAGAKTCTWSPWRMMSIASSVTTLWYSLQ